MLIPCTRHYLYIHPRALDFLLQKVSHYTLHSEKKGTETVPRGCYCYKWHPFLEGCPSVNGVPKQYPHGRQIKESQIAPRGELFRHPFFLSVVVICVTLLMELQDIPPPPTMVKQHS